MKRWRRRRRVDGVHAIPLTPAQVAAARVTGRKAMWIISLIFIGTTAAGALGTGIMLRVEAPEGHGWLAVASFIGTAVLLTCLELAWVGHEMEACQRRFS